MRILCDSATTRLNCCKLYRGHAGIKHMKCLAQGIVRWLKLDEEIETTILSCFFVRLITTILHQRFVNHARHRLHIDYAGPFLRHIWLIIIDAHWKWLKFFQISSTTSAVTIQYLRDVLSRFGITERRASDNAPNFASAEHFLFSKTDWNKMNNLSSS